MVSLPRALDEGIFSLVSYFYYQTTKATEYSTAGDPSGPASKTPPNKRMTWNSSLHFWASYESSSHRLIRAAEEWAVMLLVGPRQCSSM